MESALDEYDRRTGKKLRQHQARQPCTTAKIKDLRTLGDEIVRCKKKSCSMQDVVCEGGTSYQSVCLRVGQNFEEFSGDLPVRHAAVGPVKRDQVRGADSSSTSASASPLVSGVSPAGSTVAGRTTT